jgi:hypothetical protein
MANDVFANGREISCKAADGKSICAFPDVCFTPPENPATPPGVPIPYPNTAFAKDTTSGSKTVKITNKEVMLKNQSYFKTSTGDEAGCAAKKGIVTSKIKGKVYFTSWSMDVKIEGENAVRHLDLTTHNHGSSICNTPPIAYADRMALILTSFDCQKELERIEDECDPPEEKAICPDTRVVDEVKTNQRLIQQQHPIGSQERKDAQDIVEIALDQYAMEVKENKCLDALRCALVSFNRANAGACCPPQTPEHLIPSSQFGPNRGAGHPNYKEGRAPCLCAEGGKSTGSHGLLGASRRKYIEDHGIPVNSSNLVWTMEDSAKCGAYAAHEVDKDCSEACIESQLKRGHNNMRIDDSEPLNSKQEEVKKDLSGFKAEFVGGD